MRLLTDFYAEKWNVSKEVMHWVVDCESDYDPNAVGDGGDSFGLSQIHLPSWDGKITEGEARDPDFALNFLGQKLSEGQGRLWTCYKKKYT